MTADFDSAARFLYAVAEGTCLRVVARLAAGPASTTALAAALGLKPVNVSMHLTNLRDAGVVEGERAGRYILYRLVGAKVTGATLVLTRPGVLLTLKLDPATLIKGERS